MNTGRRGNGLPLSREVEGLQIKIYIPERRDRDDEVDRRGRKTTSKSGHGWSSLNPMHWAARTRERWKLRSC